LIDPSDNMLSIASQCKLLDLERSTFYYEPAQESAFNLQAMAAIDRIYTERPYYGKRRMSIKLREEGLDVGRELARHLMLKMGLEACYPKPKLSIPNHEHKIYPYLLRGVDIIRCNQVWSTDITYIPMRNGFFYLTAVVDWFSRYILSWRLSNSLDGLFCREALLEALERFGIPEIFNTDQGSQFTATEFVEILLKRNIKVSMDGRGRALDNVWIERIWRTVKYEDIYPRDYEDGVRLYEGLTDYFSFYNEERLHSSLKYSSPGKIYRGRGCSNSGVSGTPSPAPLGQVLRQP